MREWKTQAHVRWYCRYHVVFIPKYRKKVLYGRVRKEVGDILKELCQRFEIDMVEGHARPDHIHMCLGVPPKYSVAHAIGKLKGKSAILIHRRCFGRTKNLTGYSFWARGYCVSTVGLDEDIVRKYIRDQEHQELQIEQLPFGELINMRPAGFLKGPFEGPSSYHRLCRWSLIRLYMMEYTVNDPHIEINHGYYSYLILFIIKMI